ncbi:hypothetical protein [Kitasatospora purpeofusca]|uniref:Uncharacterized protein n=1 Tax=Kitasatospora purpeofusca TaxID=67352 RepID=A0ABZ1U9R8_9ACTN|nr:hypothetical protein [Kitasatospora purpeofusca]
MQLGFFLAVVVFCLIGAGVAQACDAIGLVSASGPKGAVWFVVTVFGAMWARGRFLGTGGSGRRD